MFLIQSVIIEGTLRVSCISGEIPNVIGSYSICLSNNSLERDISIQVPPAQSAI